MAPIKGAPGARLGVLLFFSRPSPEPEQGPEMVIGRRRIARRSHNHPRYRVDLSGVVACGVIQQMVTALEYPAADLDRLRVNVTGLVLAAERPTSWLSATSGAASSSSMSDEIANHDHMYLTYNSGKAAVQQLCRPPAQERGK